MQGGGGGGVQGGAAGVGGGGVVLVGVGPAVVLHAGQRLQFVPAPAAAAAPAPAPAVERRVAHQRQVVRVQRPHVHGAVCHRPPAEVRRRRPGRRPPAVAVRRHRQRPVVCRPRQAGRRAGVRLEGAFSVARPAVEGQQAQHDAGRARRATRHSAACNSSSSTWVTRGTGARTLGRWRDRFLYQR